MSKLDNNSVISLQDSQGSTIISLHEFQSSLDNTKELNVNIQEKIASIISPILSSAPSIAKNVQSLRSYEAVFSSEMRKLLKSGAAVIHSDKHGELLPQIIDIKSGKIVKKVRLKSGITPANIALLSWQIASMLTAQQHLAEINQKLAVISKDIKDIKSFLEDELFSQIESRILFAKSLMAAASQSPDFFQEFTNFHASNLSTSIVNTDELIRRIHRLLDRELQAFSTESFVGEEKFLTTDEGIKTAAKKYRAQVSRIVSLINLYLQLIQTQHILCMIYSLFSENSVYGNTWRDNLTSHQESLKDQMAKFKIYAESQGKNIDFDYTWWRKGILGTGMLALSPLILANEAAAKLGYSESLFKPDLKSEEIRNTTSKEASDILKMLGDKIDLTLSQMHNQVKSLNAEYRVIVTAEGDKIKNIKLLESA